MATRQTFYPMLGAIFAGVLLLMPGAGHAGNKCPIANFTPDPDFTSSFMEEQCTFTLDDMNPFFPLSIGWQTVLESDTEVSVVTVLNETFSVDGVTTRVVLEEAFEKDGEDRIQTERSRNYYAICEQTGSVLYFGEDSEELDEDGNVISTTGSWHAGTNGARPGFIMPGTRLVGGGYYEEIAPADSALDKARITAITEGCEAGEMDFNTQCVQTFNTSDCEKNSHEKKAYTAGIGNIIDQDLEITSYGFVP